MLAALAGFVHDRQTAATMSMITIRTTSKGELIATSLASQPSSAQRPIVACAYAAGLNWWRIAPQIVAFDCVQCCD